MPLCLPRPFLKAIRQRVTVKKPFNGTVEIQRSKWIFPLYLISESPQWNRSLCLGVNIASFWRKQQICRYRRRALFWIEIPMQRRRLNSTHRRSRNCVERVFAPQHLVLANASYALRAKYNSIRLAYSLIKRARVLWRAVGDSFFIFKFKKHLVAYFRRVPVYCMHATLVSDRVE